MYEMPFQTPGQKQSPISLLHVTSLQSWEVCGRAVALPPHQDFRHWLHYMRKALRVAVLPQSSQKVEPDSCNAYCNKNVVRLDDCDSDLRDTSHAFCLSPHARIEWCPYGLYGVNFAELIELSRIIKVSFTLDFHHILIQCHYSLV
jgi:hypothetical protein